MKALQILLISTLLLIGYRIAYAEESSTVLITGANRGIGLEYARAYRELGYQVIGTARRPEQANELREAGARVEQLDVTDAASVAALAERLDGVAIDILINNAGIFDRADVSLDKIDFDTMERTFRVNAFGPLRVTQALLPNLRAGKDKRIVNMSSQMGSIENSSGRWYAYRASKTALNQFTKSLSVELAPEGFVVVALHPGWVRTDMGGENATYSTDESVAGLVKVIGELDSERNGRFFDFEGKTIPW